MYKRKLSSKLLNLSRKFPIVAVLGPRQSGKTTLCWQVFEDYHYVTLEDLQNREFALSDPKGFLENYQDKKGLIIDEVQYAPDLFSYIQVIVDEKDRPGMFILTGSQNFLLNEKITQSLAGRVAILTLLPLSIEEIIPLPIQFESLLFKGGYPRLWAKKLTPMEMYGNYIRTYIERDVRQIKQVIELNEFQRFLKICAGRVGTVLNYTDLARDCGISPNTAKAWISILCASYITFLLPPYYKNFSKRLVKAPKFYFFDTGLASYLLNISNQKELASHPLKGALFENFVISEYFKSIYNQAGNPNFYYFRDHQGHEIDLIIEKQSKLFPIEIKSGKTFNTSFFDTLTYFSHLANSEKKYNVVVYGGEQSQKRSNGRVIAWKDCIQEFLA